MGHLLAVKPPAGAGARKIPLPAVGAVNESTGMAKPKDRYTRRGGVFLVRHYIRYAEREKPPRNVSRSGFLATPLHQPRWVRRSSAGGW